MIFSAKLSLANHVCFGIGKLRFGNVCVKICNAKTEIGIRLLQIVMNLGDLCATQSEVTARHVDFGAI